MTRPKNPSSGESPDRVNPLVWFNIFYEPRLLSCLIEVLKNGFDWGAGVVRLFSNEGRERLRHVDDGCGMNAENREAFLSVGYSTAGGEQSGTFGTGAKKIIFTFASNVRVVTAPEDEPDLVYIGEFTPMELAEDYSGKSSVSWKSAPKTSRIWPHEHPFGTDIVYTLKDPGSRSIYRDAKLARKLADRLDYVLVEGGMVLVNNEHLPAKQLNGRIFRLEYPAESNPAMGRIRLEFYRPAKRSSDEDLRMTGRSIGEVSFRDMFVKQLLNDDQKDMVPPLFLEGEVCGLITAGFLNDHITERRDCYDADVANDERVVELLRLLKQVEIDVASHLGIKLHGIESESAQGKDEVEQFIGRLRQKFNPTDDVPPGYEGSVDDDDGDEVGDTAGGSNGTKKPPLGGKKLPRLVINRSEFALGEQIEVSLVVPNGSPDGFHFYFDQSRAKVETEEAGKVSLLASELGRGLIRATNPMTGQSATVEYEVVVERLFHLSVRGPVSVSLGATLTIHAINADILRGSLGWELTDGVGGLKTRGQTATFRPTHSGRAQIVAYDTSHSEIRDVCDIRVLPGDNRQPPFRIRDEYFVVEFNESNMHSYRKPATIVKAGSGEVHRLIFNQLAPGFQTALQAGTLQQILAYSTAVEFAKHFCVDWSEVDASDMQSVLLDIQNEAAVLLEDML